MPQLILSSDPGFIDLALKEVRRDATDVEVVAELSSGVLLIECVEGFWGVGEAWRVEPPIFARHIMPVDVTAALRGVHDDVYMLVDVAEQEIASVLDPELPFSVQTRVFGELPYKSFDVNRSVSARLQELSAAQLDVRNPVQILSIVCADIPSQRAAAGEEIPRLEAFLGLSLADYNLSNWAGGERRFAREPGQISRAEFKLLEALEVFAIDLPPNGVALDLGAAPGGWTRILRQRDQYVTAVDPADLDKRLSRDRAVRHMKITAEAYLADEPDTFDLIVNDMRMDARDSARLMVRYQSQLYRHGIALMTFKLPEQGRRGVIDHAFNILREAYDIAGARQLFHNRSEITVYLRPRR